MRLDKDAVSVLFNLRSMRLDKDAVSRLVKTLLPPSVMLPVTAKVEDMVVGFNKPILPETLFIVNPIFVTFVPPKLSLVINSILSKSPVPL